MQWCTANFIDGESTDIFSWLWQCPYCSVRLGAAKLCSFLTFTILKATMLCLFLTIMICICSGHQGKKIGLELDLSSSAKYRMFTWRRGRTGTPASSQRRGGGRRRGRAWRTGGLRSTRRSTTWTCSWSTRRAGTAAWGHERQLPQHPWCLDLSSNLQVNLLLLDGFIFLYFE